MAALSRGQDHREGTKENRLIRIKSNGFTVLRRTCASAWHNGFMSTEEERLRKKLLHYSEEHAALTLMLHRVTAEDIKRQLDEEDRSLREYVRNIPKAPKRGRFRGYYGRSWEVLREAVMERSGGICERCHKKPVVNVHHRLPVRFFAVPNDANFLENLLAVCKKCHRKEHEEIRKNLPLFNEMLPSWRMRELRD